MVDIVNEQSVNNNVYLIIVNDQYNQELINRISRRVKIIYINRPQGNKWNVWYPFKLWAILFKINPAIIHCHTPNLIEILFLFKHKCIYTAHETGVNIKYLYKYKTLFSISNSVKVDINQRGNLDSILIYNGIHFSKFTRKYNYSFNENDKLRIIQIGRLHEEKGQDLLIKGIHRLVDRYKVKNISVDIIGDGPFQNDLEQLIEKNKLRNYVTLRGAKDRIWIYKNLYRYHLLVQPSRAEGFGLTLLEAIAAGIPVTASAIDGPIEILSYVPSSSLFDTEDADQLALNIIAMIDNYKAARIEEQCKTALRNVEKLFSVTEAAQNYLKHYAQIAEHSAPVS